MGNWCNDLLVLRGSTEVAFIVQEAGLSIKEEPYEMRVPRSQRGGEVIEPLVRDQWFVRMKPLAEPALKVHAPQIVFASDYSR